MIPIKGFYTHKITAMNIVKTWMPCNGSGHWKLEVIEYGVVREEVHCDDHELGKTLDEINQSMKEKRGKADESYLYLV